MRCYCPLRFYCTVSVSVRYIIFSHVFFCENNSCIDIMRMLKNCNFTIWFSLSLPFIISSKQSISRHQNLPFLSTMQARISYMYYIILCMIYLFQSGWVYSPCDQPVFGVPSRFSIGTTLLIQQTKRKETYPNNEEDGEGVLAE